MDIGLSKFLVMSRFRNGVIHILGIFRAPVTQQVRLFESHVKARVHNIGGPSNHILSRSCGFHVATASTNEHSLTVINVGVLYETRTMCERVTDRERGSAR
jgi:hypothetical protein